MSAKIASARFSGLFRIAPRERGTENQMVMFTTVAVGALAFMMLLPSPRAAFAAPHPEAGVVSIGASAEAGTLPTVTETDRACAGQAWGAETLDCVLAITKANGLNKVVRLADAGQHR